MDRFLVSVAHGEDVTHGAIRARTPWGAMAAVIEQYIPHDGEFRLAHIRHNDGVHMFTFKDGTVVSARPLN